MLPVEELSPTLLLASTVTVNPISNILCFVLQCLFKLSPLIVFLQMEHSRILWRLAIIFDFCLTELFTWRKPWTKRENFVSCKILWTIQPLFTLLIDDWFKLMWVFSNMIITSHVTFRLWFKVDWFYTITIIKTIKTPFGWHIITIIIIIIVIKVYIFITGSLPQWSIWCYF